MRSPYEIPHQTVEMLAAKAGPATTATGTVGTIASGGYVIVEGQAQTVAEAGLTLGHWGIIVGIVTALAGLAIQTYFGWQRNKRESEAHQASMLRANGGPQG